MVEIASRSGDMSLVFVFALFSSAVGVQLFQSTDKLCLGSIVNWNCNLDGTSIGWLHRRADGSVASSRFHSGNTSQMTLGSGPFTIGPTTISGNMATSEATTNVSDAIDGTTIECSDGGSGQNSSLLNVTGSVPPVFIGVIAISPRAILVGWADDCIQRYVLSINGIDIITNDACYIYNAPVNGPQDSIYNIQLTSFDYFGRARNPLLTVYRLNTYDFEVRHTQKWFANNTGALTIIIENNSTSDQPPPITCELIWTDGFLSDNRTCLQQRVFDFEIMAGKKYTYNVTITNIVGSSSMQKNVVGSNYLSSTSMTPTLSMTATSSTISMTPSQSMIAVTSSSCPTQPPEECDGCFFWIFGIIIGLLLFVIIVLIGIIFYLVLMKSKGPPATNTVTANNEDIENIDTKCTSSL